MDASSLPNGTPGSAIRADSQEAAPSTMSVLAAVDGGPSSAAVLDHARAVSGHLSQSIHLLHVSEVCYSCHEYGDPYYTAGQAAARTTAQARIVELARRHLPKDSIATIEVLDGVAGPTIVRHARDLGCDRIILAHRSTPGKSGLGRTARMVQEHASCPIEIVTLPGESTPESHLWHDETAAA